MSTQAEDLINIGAYVKNSNPQIDRAIEKIDAIHGFLRQNSRENVTFEAAVAALNGLFS